MVILVDDGAGRAGRAVGAASETGATALSPLRSSAAGAAGRVLASRRGRWVVAAASGGEDREARVVGPPAARAGNELGRALDLLEGEVRVVGVLEPIEAPVASGLETGRERGAFAPGADATVLSTGQTAELPGATVKETDTTARNVQIKMVGSKICAGAGRLNDHCLSCHGARSESERVAGTAPR